jgi:hypothetical protein
MAQLTDDWNSINEIVIYGLGMVSNRVIEKLSKDFRILGLNHICMQSWSEP